MLITLHGFGTTGEGSKLCQAIHKLAEDNGSLSFTPTYPTNNPHLANIYLSNYLKEKMDDYGENPTLIGFDLGGFWARYLATLSLPNRLILINPDITPWNSLGPYVGQNVNNGNGEKFGLAINDVAAFYVYRVREDLLGLNVKLVLSKDDEIFNAEQTIDEFKDLHKLSVDVVEGGHTFSDDYTEVLQIIKDDLFPEEEDNEEPES